jgi:hypothetical protein
MAIAPPGDLMGGATMPGSSRRPGEISPCAARMARSLLRRPDPRTSVMPAPSPRFEPPVQQWRGGRTAVRDARCDELRRR